MSGAPAGDLLAGARASRRGTRLLAGAAGGRDAGGGGGRAGLYVAGLVVLDVSPVRIWQGWASWAPSWR